MEQEMLTLNWTDDRTFDEAAVRAYFTGKGWTLSDDDAVKDDTRFRIVDFGKANCLNFVAPLEELPQDVYDFILGLTDAPKITLGVEGEYDTEIINTWTWKEFVEVLNGDDTNE
tara:strand:+ start:1977 stop:2318 length:342 start_codon:yes stop_codon:yes gene_type:complete